MDPIEQAKTAGDVAAGVITLAALLEHAPQIAAVFTAAYVFARFLETRLARKVLRAVCRRCAEAWEKD